MTVNSYLSDLGSSLVLSESEKSHITTSIDTIKRRLDSYFNGIQEKKVFGSYARATILPRKADDNSDVDLMVVFYNSSNYKPQTYLNWLKQFAEYYYSSSEIYQSSPTVVLELNHIKFELTPAWTCFNTYYIPNGASEWIATDPDGFYSELTECNKNNSYKIKPIVRLLKHWNIQKNNRKLASYILEKKIASELKYAYFSCSTYTEYLIKAFEAIQYSTDYSNVSSAIGHIKKALEYERKDMPCSASLEIKKVFPEV